MMRCAPGAPVSLKRIGLNRLALCRSMGIVWVDALPRALRMAASAAISGLSQPAARWGKQRYATLGQGRGCLALRVAGDRGNGSPPPRRNEPV